MDGRVPNGYPTRAPDMTQPDPINNGSGPGQKTMGRVSVPPKMVGLGRVHRFCDYELLSSFCCVTSARFCLSLVSDTSVLVNYRKSSNKPPGG